MGGGREWVGVGGSGLGGLGAGHERWLGSSRNGDRGRGDKGGTGAEAGVARYLYGKINPFQ